MSESPYSSTTHMLAGLVDIETLTILVSASDMDGCNSSSVFRVTVSRSFGCVSYCLNTEFGFVEGTDYFWPCCLIGDMMR